MTLYGLFLEGLKELLRTINHRIYRIPYVFFEWSPRNIYVLVTLSIQCECLSSVIDASL